MFHGSIVALITPMTESAAVDYSALRKLLDYQLEGGTQGIVVTGTTGESVSLSRDEFGKILQTTLEHVDGQVPVIAGTGSANTINTIAMTQMASELGAQAALIVTPYYNRPPQKGLVAHYSAIANAVDLPLILYNVPGRTAVDLLPETVAEIAGLGHAVALKESVGQPERLQELRNLCPENFAIISGDDPSCGLSILNGASGVISVASNIAPRHMSELVKAARSGDIERTKQLNSELSELFRQLALATNPIPVKWAAWKLGLVGSGIRLPLVPLDHQYHAGLMSALSDLGLTRE